MAVKKIASVDGLGHGSFFFTYSAFVSFWIWRNLCAFSIQVAESREMVQRVIIPLSFAFKKMASQPVMRARTCSPLPFVFFGLICENIHRSRKIFSRSHLRFGFSLWKRIIGLKKLKWYYSTRVPETFRAFKRPWKKLLLWRLRSFPFDLGCFGSAYFQGAY